MKIIRLEIYENVCESWTKYNDDHLFLIILGDRDVQGSELLAQDDLSLLHRKPDITNSF